jgi:hypothetical protein
VRRYGVVVGVTAHGQVIKQCPCGRRRIGLVWEPARALEARRTRA